MIDPLADKVLVAALYGSLTFVELIPRENLVFYRRIFERESSVPLTLLVLARDAALILYTMIKRYTMLDEPRTFARYWNPNNATVHVTPTLISKVWP